jgi:hypothetical protein
MKLVLVKNIEENKLEVIAEENLSQGSSSSDLSSRILKNKKN